MAKKKSKKPQNVKQPNSQSTKVMPVIEEEAEIEQLFEAEEKPTE